jgi:hypothetical protein
MGVEGSKEFPRGSNTRLAPKSGVLTPFSRVLPEKRKAEAGKGKTRIAKG